MSQSPARERLRSPFVSIVLERCKLNTFFEVVPGVADGVRKVLKK